MENILKYLHFKYNENWNDIHNAIKSKEYVDLELIEEMKTKYNFDDYITIIDNDYPDILKKMNCPPFVIKRDTKIINGLLVDVNKNETSQHVLMYTGIKDIYKMLNIDLFAIVSRKIGDKYYDIYCDDKALMKENQKPSLITLDKNKRIIEVIYGSIFVCQSNKDGETISINEDDIKNILKNRVTIIKDDSTFSCICANI